jgi:hypothetical protein
VSHRFRKREIINTPDEVDDVAALSTSIANPPARPTVDIKIRASPIKVKRAATHECGAGATQLDAIASDQVADGMSGSKLLSVDDGSHVELAGQRSD